MRIKTNYQSRSNQRVNQDQNPYFGTHFKYSIVGEAKKNLVQIAESTDPKEIGVIGKIQQMFSNINNKLSEDGKKAFGRFKVTEIIVTPIEDEANVFGNYVIRIGGKKMERLLRLGSTVNLDNEAKGINIYDFSGAELLENNKEMIEILEKKH